MRRRGPGGGKGLEIGPTLVLYRFVSPFSCDPNRLAEKGKQLSSCFDFLSREYQIIQLAPPFTPTPPPLSLHLTSPPAHMYCNPDKSRGFHHLSYIIFIHSQKTAPTSCYVRSDLENDALHRLKNSIPFRTSSSQHVISRRTFQKNKTITTSP